MNLRDILQQVGFKGSALDTAYAIAMAESSGNARAFNGNRKTGDQSYGLFQINMLGGMGPERRRQYGLSTNDDLFDAVKNAQVAYKMSKGGTDWSPWSTYKRGDYRKYLGQSGATVTGAAAGAAVGAGIGIDQPEEQPQQADIIGSNLGADFAPGAQGFGAKAQGFQRPDATLQAPAQQRQGIASGGSTDVRDRIVAAAMSVLGTPYSWGGGSKKGASRGILYAGKDGRGTVGFDCSSLMMFAFAQAGIDIPRTGRPQLRMGKRVPLSQLQPGDFLGWGDGHHIAMYIGDGKYIQAPSTGGHVEIKSLSKGSSAWGVHLSLPGD